MSAIHRTGLIALLLGLALWARLGHGTLRADPGDRAVRFELALDKEKYEVGEPIELRIRLTNVGTAAVTVSTSSEITGRHDGYAFVVRKDGGGAIRDPGNEYISLMHSLGSGESLEPGGSHTRTLTLNYRVPPLAPGRYTVQGTWQPGNPGPEVRGESPVVPFDIVDTPPARLEARVARLTREFRDGAGARRIAPLLGFTGHPAAVAPLIDMLYLKNDGDQVAAAQALLYLDWADVRKALTESLKARGPRDRLTHLLIVRLRAEPGEVVRSLLKWLDDRDGDTRYAAVEGLALANRGKDPKVFAHLEARLKDPLPRVRQRAAAAVGVYADAAALKALKTVVEDPDAGVREQVTIAVGWVAAAAQPESAVRKEAVGILRSIRLTGGTVANQAAYWLDKLGDK